MNKENISESQGMCMIILFISSIALVLPIATEGKRDIWICTLTGILLAIPIFMIYAQFSSNDLRHHWMDLLMDAFGTILGKAIFILYIGFVVHLGCFALRIFGEYPSTVSIEETPISVGMFFLILLCIWGVKEGIEVIGRWSKLFVLLNGPIPSILILMLIPQMNIDHIKPVLYNGWRPVFRGIFSAFTTPFTEAVVFIMIFSFFGNRKKAYKAYVRGLLLSGLLVFGVTLAEVLVVGIDLYPSTFFINYSVAGKVDIGNFLQRMEVIVILATLTSGFIKISACLLAACKGIQHLFHLSDYRNLVTPVGLWMFNIALILHENMIELYEWASKVWSIYEVFFECIIPLLVWIILKFKNRKKQKSIKVHDFL